MNEERIFLEIFNFSVIYEGCSISLFEVVCTVAPTSISYFSWIALSFREIITIDVKFVSVIDNGMYIVHAD